MAVVIARTLLASAITAGLLAPSAAAAPRKVFSVESTCYAEHGLMADGSRTRDRSAAANNLPLGSKIRLIGPRAFLGGKRIFVIRDRIGSGSELDLWHPSNAACNRWGRKQVRYVVIHYGNGRLG